MKQINSVIIALALLFTACGEKQRVAPVSSQAIDYADMTYWYAFGENDKPADVFYVYPTVSTVSFVDNDSSWFLPFIPGLS